MLDQPIHRLELNWTVQNILLNETLRAPAGKATELSHGSLGIDNVPLVCPTWPHISGFSGTYGVCRPGHQHQTGKQSFNFLSGFSSGLQVINFQVMG